MPPNGEGIPIERHERFEQMYRRYEQRLLGYALRRARVEMAKDAVADTFLAAWRRFEELPDDPLPWLIGTTRKALANQRRSSARQGLVTERLAWEHVERSETEDDGHEAELVRNAFGRLTADDREVLALVAWDGLTRAQAARSLGCSTVAFRVRLHRARRRLASALAEQERAVGVKADWCAHKAAAKELS